MATWFRTSSASFKCVITPFGCRRCKAAQTEIQRRVLPDQYAGAGRYTWDIDGALPAPHAMRLYGTLGAEEAAILAQCRTGHNFLNPYLHQIRRSDTKACRCGRGEETLRHVIPYCQLWDTQRQVLKANLGGEILGDVSFLVGGWSDRID